MVSPEWPTVLAHNLYTSGPNFSFQPAWYLDGVLHLFEEGFKQVVGAYKYMLENING